MVTDDIDKLPGIFEALDGEIKVTILVEEYDRSRSANIIIILHLDSETLHHVQ